MRLVSLLLRLYHVPVLGQVARGLLVAMGTDIPRSVIIGRDVTFKHRAIGVVMHPSTRLEDWAVVFQGVTVGMAEVGASEGVGEIVIGEGAVLAAGAKVLAPPEGLRVGRHTVIAANAVLTRSTGDDEVWAGVPARLVGPRKTT